MRRVSRYSSSGGPAHSRATPSRTADPFPRSGAPAPGVEVAPGAPAAPSVPIGSRLRGLLVRNERVALLSLGGVIALSVVLLSGVFSEEPTALTQADIDAAVVHTLENLPPGPSEESMAFDVIRPSVVRVRRLDEAEGEEGTLDAGTGVIIVDDGTILTNLHVVTGAERIGVVFADGTESSAEVVAVRPEQDLAVIRARTLPDDIVPATMSSSRDLRPGDRVVAVGFPFGIGPSASAGVVSGLRREYRTPEGERVLSNLIQFDAAANPGNSGGPLITMDGRVVGIVTAILNPSSQRFFIGIGFAVPIESAASAAGQSPF
jgi:S1-C subfamily serine protease